MKKAWIVGASSGLGKALADQLASEGVSLVLSARSAEALEASAKHYRTTGRVEASVLTLDLSVPISEQVISDFLTSNRDIDAVFVCVGGAHDQDQIPLLRDTIDSLFQQNCIGPALVLSKCIQHLNLRTCVVVSSISARVPRVENASYSASKTALEEMVKSMNIYLYRSQKLYQIKVIRLGYMKSQWTAGRRLLFPVIEPAAAAKAILFRLEQKSNLLYVPVFWFWIHGILRWLPWFIYRKLKF